MSKDKVQQLKNSLFLLDIDDVCGVTGWCKNTVRNLFAYETDFPAIKIGKKYLVELDAFKTYLSIRRD
mgnify:CR=1 FL=1